LSYPNLLALIHTCTFYLCPTPRIISDKRPLLQTYPIVPQNIILYKCFKNLQASLLDNHSFSQNVFFPKSSSWINFGTKFPKVGETVTLRFSVLSLFRKYCNRIHSVVIPDFDHNGSMYFIQSYLLFTIRILRINHTCCMKFIQLYAHIRDNAFIHTHT